MRPFHGRDPGSNPGGGVLLLLSYTNRKPYIYNNSKHFMTSVMGLKHPTVNATVLIADRQTTFSDNKGMPKGENLGRKLWSSKNKNFCFGHAGNLDNELYDFIEKFAGEEFDVKKIIKKGYFPELRKLNINRMGKRLPGENLSGLILATRFDKNPKLYTCFPLGSVEERGWTCLGSGDQKIIEYMEALRTMQEAQDYLGNSSTIQIKEVIKTGLEAVRRAQSQDIYSQGLDMMICTPKKLIDHYANLGDDFGEKLANIQKRYTKMEL